MQEALQSTQPFFCEPQNVLFIFATTCENKGKTQGLSKTKCSFIFIIFMVKTSYLKQFLLDSMIFYFGTS